MFAFISRFFGWLLKTKRRVMAICDDVVQFARAAESLPPRVLPKYLVAFTDDGPSDTDDNPIMDDDDQFDILTSCEKSPCDV
jgi:hypothetical protein